MIREEKQSEDCYKLYYDNGVYIGQAIMNDDGYFVLFPEHRGGYWDQGILLMLYDYFHEKNKDWDESVNEFLDNVIKS